MRKSGKEDGKGDKRKCTDGFRLDHRLGDVAIIYLHAILLHFSLCCCDAPSCVFLILTRLVSPPSLLDIAPRRQACESAPRLGLTLSFHTPVNIKKPLCNPTTGAVFAYLSAKTNGAQQSRLVTTKVLNFSNFGNHHTTLVHVPRKEQRVKNGSYWLYLTGRC